MSQDKADELNGFTEAINDGLGYEIAEIPPHHWEMLRAIFEERGAPLPDPRTSIIVGALSTAEEDRGALMCFAVVQRAMHAEPFVVFPQYEGRNLHTALYDHIDHTLSQGMEDVSYFVTVTEPALERRLEGRGFTHVGALWRKDIEGLAERAAKAYFATHPEEAAD